MEGVAPSSALLPVRYNRLLECTLLKEGHEVKWNKTLIGKNKALW